MKIDKTALLLFLISILGGFQVSAQQLNADAVDAWRQDLRYMSERMSAVHPNLFHDVSRLKFEASIKKLDSRIPSLSREQIIVEMQRIVATIGEGHTQMGLVWDKNIGFRQYPIRLYLYSDGLYVKAASDEYSSALGKKVVRIGKLSAAQAMKIIRPLAQHDNDMTIRDVLPNLLVIPEVLHSLGIISNEEKARFTVADHQGNRSFVDVNPVSRATVIKFVRANEQTKTPLPLYLKNRTDNYWYEYLPESQTVYVQFNAVQDKEGETIATFFQRVFSFVRSNPVKRFVLDIRSNNGGDNTLNKPIIDGIRASGINVKGRLFTIIGRLTFSAAQNLANDLEKNTNTLFVGEPTGGKPNHYGDATNLVLPNSKVIVRVSTRYWQDMPETDKRRSIYPQLKAELSSRDYSINNDPAMQAILSFKEK